MLNSQINQNTSTNFLQRHWTKLAALAFWTIIVGGYYWYARQNNLTLQTGVYRIAGLLTDSFYAPVFYVILYTLRPLLFFPATLLTLLSGFLFGPTAILYTIIGSNASAMVAYGVGQYFGQDILDNPDNAGVIQRYTQRMRENSFETVLIMRLIFLPYDLVNYAAGFLKINWKAFITATAIGSVPGTISIVLLGASFGTLDELINGDVQLNPVTLIASVLIIGVSIGLSRTVKKREARASSTR